MIAKSFLVVHNALVMSEAVTNDDSEMPSLLHQMEQKLIHLIAQAAQQKSYGQLSLTAFVDAGNVVSLKVGFIEQIR